MHSFPLRNQTEWNIGAKIWRRLLQGCQRPTRYVRLHGKGTPWINKKKHNFLKSNIYAWPSAIFPSFLLIYIFFNIFPAFFLLIIFSIFIPPPNLPYLSASGSISSEFLRRSLIILFTQDYRTLYLQRFGRYFFRPFSDVPCRTLEPTRNFEPRPSSNSRVSLAVIPLTITGYKGRVFLYCYSPALRIEPATSWWLSQRSLGNQRLWRRLEGISAKMFYIYMCVCVCVCD